jgi:hypothetical protein
MNPPFASRNAAIGAILANLALLALPLIVGKLKPASQQSAWASLQVSQGSIASNNKVLYQDQGDADILIVGSSSLHVALTFPELRDAASKSLNRPARIDSLIIYGPGWDWIYFAVQEYLSRHRAHLVIIQDPVALLTTNEPHRYMPHWLRYGDGTDVLTGLGLASRTQVFSSLVLGGPRQAINLVRPSLIGENEKIDGIVNDVQRAFLQTTYAGRKFKEIQQPLPVPPKVGFWSSDAPEVRVEGRLGTYNRYFIQKIHDLVLNSGSHIAFIHTNGLDEFPRDYIPELVDYREFNSKGPIILGQPIAQLFPSMNREQITEYYSDVRHFNANGARVFTRAMIPAILEAYREAQKD